MTTKRVLCASMTAALFLLAGCGGDGVALGEFPNQTKTEGDEPFKLTAPSSDSPAPFSYTSSNEAVAKIAGDTVTVGVEGTATITARQPEYKSYKPTSTSMLLTVKARVCPEHTVREGGKCVAVPTTASFVTQGGLTWMPATFVATWAEADAYCKTTRIQDQTGWKLPDQAQLATLAASGALEGQGWASGDAWSATAGSAADSHLAVSLASGGSTTLAKDGKAYVSCVR